MVKKLLGLVLTLSLVALLAPARADAVIGSYRWGYGTIYVKNVTPSHPWSPDMANRVLYYHNLGAHWNVVQGDCRTGYPCVRLSIGYYGATDWLGLTHWPKACGGTYTFCNFAGNMNDQDRMAMVMINTYYADTWLADTSYRRKVGCHEFGHALAYLRHDASAGTCMNAPIDYNTTPEFLSATNVNELKTRFASTALAPCTGCSTLEPISGDAPADELLLAPAA